MKRILFVFIVYILFVANRTGRNEGTAGAPNETDNVTCENCHIRGAFKPFIQLELLNQSGQKIKKITPNTDYTVQITLLDSTNRASVYGFQMVPLHADQKMAGSFPTIGQRVKRVNDLGRVYLSHSARSTSPNFTATWRSPSPTNLLDSIKFYLAGVTGNDDNNSIGDNARLATRTYYYEGTTSTTALDADNKTFLVNTVSSDYLRIKDHSSIDQISIFDKNGILNKRITEISNYAVDISSLSSGAYLLTIQSEGRSYLEKFVKI
jgi:hypothetical protein